MDRREKVRNDQGRNQGPVRSASTVQVATATQASGLLAKGGGGVFHSGFCASLLTRLTLLPEVGILEKRRTSVTSLERRLSVLHKGAGKEREKRKPRKKEVKQQWTACDFDVFCHLFVFHGATSPLPDDTKQDSRGYMRYTYRLLDTPVRGQGVVRGGLDSVLIELTLLGVSSGFLDVLG